MQFLEFLSLLQKTWTIICEFWNFFLFSKNVDYHMQFLNFFPFSKNVDYHMQFLEILSLFQKRGLLYAFSEISSPSPKTWTIICEFWNFYRFSKTRGLSYSISRISFSSSKTWTIICNF